jgi:transposase
MMVALLLYAYAIGITSRRIAKACVERVDLMAIVALAAPDFRTISEFRRRHLAALSALFEVMKVFPNLVSQDMNTGYYKLDYQGLIAPIVQAIQAIASRLTTLEQTVA